MKDFWKKQAQKWPMVFLSPMDGYTDSAYRQVNKRVNPDIFTVSEFYSVDGLVHSKFLASSVLPHADIEKPLIIQVFGKDPEMFAKAAKIIERYDIAGIDVNMGCPAKKVVKSGHGSGLIINQDTAFQIVETLNKATKLPVSVKTRLGWDGSGTLINFVKWLESAGASLIAVHGRTAAQAYTGTADFTQIYELKKHVSIPVVCNGDIQNIDDGLAKLTSPDGSVTLDWCMIRRATYGNPWCFVKGGYTPNLGEILDTMDFHARALLVSKWEKKAPLDIRKHLVQYLKGFPWVSAYRKRLVTVATIEVLLDLLEEIRNEFAQYLHIPPREIVLEEK